MRRFLSYLCLLLFAALPLHAEKVKTLPGPSSYIDDFAKVLSEDANAQMQAICAEVHDKTKAQIYVVTVHKLEGESVDQFANELFAKWKIGEKKTDRGILMLFAIDDHKWRIEVGYGFEGILNDAKAGDIGRSMVPGLKQADYDGALQLGLQQVAQIVADDSHITLDSLAPPPEDTTQQTQQAVIQFDQKEEARERRERLYAKIVPVLVFAFMIVFLLLWNRFGWKGSSSSGSSSSSSSSDDSGDGGSSGGGGASGDW